MYMYAQFSPYSLGDEFLYPLLRSSRDPDPLRDFRNMTAL